MWQLCFLFSHKNESHETSHNNFNSKPNSSDYHTSTIGLEFEFLCLNVKSTPERSRNAKHKIGTALYIGRKWSKCHECVELFPPRMLFWMHMPCDFLQIQYEVEGTSNNYPLTYHFDGILAAWHTTIFQGSSNLKQNVTDGMKNWCRQYLD